MNALLNALDYASETLDKPGRAIRGLIAGRPDELKNLIPFSDTMGITNPDKSVSGRQLLETYGLVPPDEEGFDMGDLGGFAAELLTDPLTWAGIGAGQRMLGLRKAAEAANTNKRLGLWSRFARQGADPYGRLKVGLEATHAPIKHPTYLQAIKALDDYGLAAGAPTGLRALSEIERTIMNAQNRNPEDESLAWMDQI